MITDTILNTVLASENVYLYTHEIRNAYFDPLRGLVCKVDQNNFAEPNENGSKYGSIYNPKLTLGEIIVFL